MHGGPDPAEVQQDPVPLRSTRGFSKSTCFHHQFLLPYFGCAQLQGSWEHSFGLGLHECCQHWGATVYCTSILGLFNFLSTIFTIRGAIEVVVLFLFFHPVPEASHCAMALLCYNHIAASCTLLNCPELVQCQCNAEKGLTTDQSVLWKTASPPVCKTDTTVEPNRHRHERHLLNRSTMNYTKGKNVD